MSLSHEVSRIIRHPIFKQLADDVSDFTDVNIDDAELEKVMMHEDNTLSASRIVQREVAFNHMETKLPRGTLTSRLRTLANESIGCTMQQDFRMKMHDHPAFELVADELRQVNAVGDIAKAFDLIESIGVTVAFDKSEQILTLGFNLDKMNMGIREHSKMFDSNNKRIIDRINGDYFGRTLINQVKDMPTEVMPVGGMSVSFYISFQI